MVTTNPASVVGELTKLADLFRADALTDEEYLAAKALVLRGTPAEAPAITPAASQAPIDPGKFYEIAAREIAGNRLSPAAWGRAMSESEGNGERSRALYIRLRTQELSNLLAQSPTQEYLRHVWHTIKAGEYFICPTCKQVTTARSVENDFLACVFNKVPKHSYFCRTCNDQLAAVRYGRAPGGEAASGQITLPGGPIDKAHSSSSITGFVLGLASVPLYFIGIIPVLAIIFSSVGLASHDESKHKGRWMASVGLLLGIVFTLMAVSLYHGGR